MRNLILQNIHILENSEIIKFIKENIIGENNIIEMIFDEINKVILILTESCILKFKFTLIEDIKFSNSTLLKIHQFNEKTKINLKDITKDEIKLFIYKNEEDSFHIILRNGNYITNYDSIKMITSDNFQFIRKINEIDEESEIVSSKISPNLEHIVCIFSNYTLILINFDFEIINQCDLDDGEGTILFNFKDSKLKYADISFRGDSEYFVVHYKLGEGSKCLVRDLKANIFKGPAKADNKIVFSLSEEIQSNYDISISWQYNGSLFAIFNNQEYIIKFAEKNCLIHGEIKLKQLINDQNDIFFQNNYKINAQQILFSRENNILLIVFKISNENIFIENQIVILYRSNYNWSIKFRKRFGNEKMVQNVQFSEISTLKIKIALNDLGSCFNSVEFLDFKLDYNNSLSNNNFLNDKSTIISFDSNKLKFIPLYYGSIPPPMAFCEMNIDLNYPYILNTFKNKYFIIGTNGICIIEQIEKDFNQIYIKKDIIFEKIINIQEFIVSEYNKNELFIIILSLNSNNMQLLSIVKINFQNDEIVKSNFFINSLKITNLFNSVKHENLVDFNFYKNTEKEKVNDNNKKEFDLIAGLSGHNKINIKTFQDFKDFDDNNHSFDEFEKTQEIKKSEPNKLLFNISCIRLKDNYSKNISLCEIDIDELSNIDNKSFEEVFNIENLFDIISTPIKIKTCLLNINILNKNFTENIIYLAKNNKLYIDDILIANDISSFEIYENFLLIIQNSNSPYSTLHFINLANFSLIEFKYPLVPDFHSKSIYIRTIERGSLLVGVTKSTIILQAPRGNLETFSPRVLVLNNIKNLIKNKNYSEAFEQVRKHKINMNFLYDIDPESLLVNIKSFIDQIRKPDFLNLFINSLVNELSDEALQIGGIAISEKGNLVDLKTEEFKRRFIHNKINNICNQMLICLFDNNIGRYNIKYITSTLQILCKKNPPEYLKALTIVKDSDPIQSEIGLEYLCWIVNSTVLYNFALQTYDFELIIMVAKKTQKDPKDFLPYLEKLKSMDSYLMKYTINYDLKEYNRAVIELSKGGEIYINKVIETIKKHDLIEVIKDLYIDFPILRKNIFSFLSENLIKKNKFHEGSYAALKAGNNKLALYCFYKNGCIKQALNILTYEKETLNIEENKIIINENEFLSLNNFLFDILNISFAYKKDFEIEQLMNLIISTYDKGNTFPYLNLNYEEELNLKQKIIIRILEIFINLKKWTKAYYLCNLFERIKINSDFNLINEMKMKILFEVDLIKNDILLDEKEYDDKYNRLLIIQSEKKQNPNLLEDYNKYNKDINLEDNFSETGSIISEGASHDSHKSNKSKKSNISKLTKKAQNKLSKRNIKKGSPLEEDYIIIILQEINDKYLSLNKEDDINDICYSLILLDFIEFSNEIKNSYESLKIKIKNNSPYFNVYQQDFINKYPDVKILFNGISLSKPLLSLSLNNKGDKK